MNGFEKLSDKGVARIVGGTKVGCSHVEKLDLRGTQVGPKATNALVHFLGSGLLSELGVLLISGTSFRPSRVGEGPLVDLFTGLRGCRHLSELTFGYANVGRVVCEALHGALGDNCWPFLKTLMCYRDYEEDLHDLAAALSVKGAARRLEVLQVKGHRCRHLDADGLQDSARVFRQGACPALRTFGVCGESAKMLSDAVHNRRHNVLREYLALQLWLKGV